MNANELADEWDKYCGETLEWNGKSSKVLSTMLRQQALEIQALHQILGYEGVAVGQDYLDECVAILRKAQE
jgi:hypothetical protein